MTKAEYGVLEVDMNKEIWMQIPGFGDHYEASSLGRIRSKDRVVLKRTRHTGEMMEQRYKGRILECNAKGKYGYLYAHLGVNGKKTSIGVHRLVLFAFVGPAPVGHEACHNNGIAWDNRIGNLRWGSHYENNQDRKKHGTYPSGNEHHMSEFDESAIKEIFERRITVRQAMRKYGISQTHVYRVRRGETWKKQLGVQA